MSEHERRNDWTVFAAIGLIGLGVWFLLGNLLGHGWQDAIQRAVRLMWPIALIALGVLLYAASSRRPSAQAAGRRLYRSRSDRMISGVLGGVAAYFGIDPTIVRILYVVFGVLMGLWPGFVVYLIASIVVPEEPIGGAAGSPSVPQWPTGPAEPPAAPPSGEGWPQGWPHTGTETVQTPPAPPAPAPPAPSDEPPAKPSDDSAAG